MEADDILHTSFIMKHHWSPQQFCKNYHVNLLGTGHLRIRLVCVWNTVVLINELCVCTTSTVAHDPILACVVC